MNRLNAAALVFDFASRASDEPYVFATGASWLILIGIIAALVAATVGFLDLLAIPTGTPAFRTGLTHMALNLTVVGLEAIGFAVRRGRLHNPHGTPIGLIVLAGLALVLLGAAGRMGRLVCRAVADDPENDRCCVCERRGAEPPGQRPQARHREIESLLLARAQRDVI